MGDKPERMPAQMPAILVVVFIASILSTEIDF